MGRDSGGVTKWVSRGRGRVGAKGCGGVGVTWLLS